MKKQSVDQLFFQLSWKYNKNKNHSNKVLEWF